MLQLMSRYYLDSGVLVWNGNGTVGKDLIQKFFEGLPPSEHTLTSLDSQPVLGKHLHSTLVLRRFESQRTGYPTDPKTSLEYPVGMCKNAFLSSRLDEDKNLEIF